MLHLRDLLLLTLTLLVFSSVTKGQELVGISPGGQTSLLGFYKDQINSPNNQTICTFSLGGLVAGTQTYDPVQDRYFLVNGEGRIITIQILDNSCTISASDAFSDPIRFIDWDVHNNRLIGVQFVEANNTHRLISPSITGGSTTTFNASISTDITGGLSAGVHAFDPETGTYYIAASDQVYFLRTNGATGIGAFSPFGSLRSIEYDTKINRLLGIISDSNSVSLVIANGQNFSFLGTHQNSDGLRLGVNAYYDETGLFTVATGTKLITFNRVGNAFETPISTSLISMEYAHRDSDGDALPDAWEINGIEGVELPEMGADPFIRDIFVEIDYMRDFTHTHQPSPLATKRVMESFQQNGINLHVDAGFTSLMTLNPPRQWLERSNSNSVGHTDLLGGFSNDNYLWEGSSGVFFNGYKNSSNNFLASRRGIFHYVIFAHHLNVLCGDIPTKCPANADPNMPIGFSGVSNGIPGSDFIVSLGERRRPEAEEAGTFMHELGHNINLTHEGNQNTANGVFNYKPNFLSVMNYAYQKSGISSIAEASKLDYSSGQQSILQESNLNETSANVSLEGFFIQRFCNVTGTYLPTVTAVSESLEVDWDCDGLPNNTALQYDLNDLGGNSQILGDFDDWSNISLNGSGLGQFGQPPPIVILANVDEASEMELDLVESIPGLLINPSSRLIPVLPGDSFNYAVEITNETEQEENTEIIFTSFFGWSSLAGGTPVEVTLQPQQTITLQVTANIPIDTLEGEFDQTTIEVNSQTTVGHVVSSHIELIYLEEVFASGFEFN